MFTVTFEVGRGDIIIPILLMEKYDFAFQDVWL